MESVNFFGNKISSLLDNSEYIEAKNRLEIEFNAINKNEERYPYILAEIAGFYIDIGSETLDKDSTDKGLKILFDEEELFKGLMSKQSMNYCLGNGMHALYKIQTGMTTFPTLEMIKPNLSQAKNYYLKAFKEIDFKNITHIDLQVLTNLGSNLSQSGRVVEAIKLYNAVLGINSEFPQALIGLAEDLDYWTKISMSSRSISFYTHVFILYKKGLSIGTIPHKQKMHYERKMKFYERLLIENKFNFSSLERELELNEEEYKKHNVQRKFYIDNFLSLNEHSLYCKCSGASIDDLSIVHSGIRIFGEKVGKMELLLNRLKSEFNLARKLYYEGVTQKDNYVDINYSELMDGELVGEEVEKIRTSFRLCFGILDKIAHGICYFFDLPKAKRENIYFNSFWDSTQCPERWEKLRVLKNQHLLALFSIANDLNSNNQGEFHFYREWRNAIEHNNLVLVNRTDDSDLFKLFEDDAFVTKVSYSFFQEQALHLLQICCAAIYSYTYSIRTESLNSNDDLPTVPFVIQPKVKY